MRKDRAVWRPLLCSVGIAAFLAGHGGAWASCSGRMTANPPPAADYNPFAPADLVRTGRVTIENRGDEPCLFRLDFALNPVPASAGQTLEFELRGPAGDMLAASGFDRKAAAGSTAGPLAAGESLDLNYELRLVAGQMRPPGQHELAFELTLREAATMGLQRAAILDRAAVSVMVSVADRIGVNIAGGGLFKTIDFGELREGDRRRVLIEVRGNRNFVLEATSRNGGVLAMDAPHQRWRIVYTVSLDGARIDPPGRVGPFAPTSLAGRTVEAAFTIGETSNKRAGLYTDEIVIEIKPAL
jgi:hypothetical protein